MKKTFYLLLWSALVFPAMIFGQGSLTPSGPPGPTMKTLDQLEARIPITSVPITLTNPGSYYFVSNLTCLVNSNGITVSADPVTIDLNGYALNGSGGTQSNGVYVTGSVFGFILRNGFIRNWKNGVMANNAYSGVFSDLHVSICSSNGIVAGNSAVISHCTAISVTGTGIVSGNSSVVRDCTAESCTAGGIYAYFGTTVANCSVLGTGSAFSGIYGNTGSLIKDCTCFNNNGIAIGTSGSCVINGCVVANNFNTGISTTYSLVQGCTVNGNSGDGILMGVHGRIFDNDCYSNGTSSNSNIHVTGNYCRVEGNHCTSGLRGFKIDSSSNIVVRNSATSNTTNYVVAAGNAVGAYIGTSTASTNTNPQANFDF